jgi:hypothetical protein
MVNTKLMRINLFSVTLRHLFYGLLLLLIACTQPKPATPPAPIHTPDYTLLLPAEKPQGVLVLFPGFGETPTDVLREFNIQSAAATQKVAVLVLSTNKRLWLEPTQKDSLATLCHQVWQQYTLPTNHVVFGGFSAGGNLAFQLAGGLHQQHATIQPVGVFAIDSPLDLAKLNQTAAKNITLNVSETAIAEAKMLQHMFQSSFGSTDTGFLQRTVFDATHGDSLCVFLPANTRLRLYTEPDTAWWHLNRGVEFDNTNASMLQHMATALKPHYGNNLELVETKNRGIRSNGNRHPHSWSIVDPNDLLKWMKQ